MPPRTLSDSDMELIADRAARKAVETAFRSLGVDISDPAALRAWHADQSWTRAAREGSSKIGLSIKTTLVGSIVTAVLALIWTAFKSGQPPPGAP
jgi:hypothetical protein